MNRGWALLGIAAGLALALYAIFAPASDDEVIRRRLAELEQVTSWDSSDQNPMQRALRIREVVLELFTPESLVHVADLPMPSPDRHALSLLAVDASRKYKAVTVDIDNVRVELSADENSAQVGSDVTLSAEHYGQHHQQKREVTMQWVKRKGEWLIARLDVPSENQDEPEARP
jgi:hypothetical protein